MAARLALAMALCVAARLPSQARASGIDTSVVSFVRPLYDAPYYDMSRAALSADGTTLAVSLWNPFEDEFPYAVSHPFPTATAIYTRAIGTDTWTFETYFRRRAPSEDHGFYEVFGETHSIALSGDGRTLVARSPENGMADIWETSSTGPWTYCSSLSPQQELNNGTVHTALEYDGIAVSISLDGRTVAIPSARSSEGRASSNGVAFFRKAGKAVCSPWSLVDTVMPTSASGNMSVDPFEIAMREDGRVVLAGATKDPWLDGDNDTRVDTDVTAFVFETADGTSWRQTAWLSDPDAHLRTGRYREKRAQTVALSGDTAVVAFSMWYVEYDINGEVKNLPGRAGAIYVWQRDASSGAWDFRQRLIAAADADHGPDELSFVRISGDSMLGLAPQGDSKWALFSREAGVWTAQQTPLDPVFEFTAFGRFGALAKSLMVVAGSWNNYVYIWGSALPSILVDGVTLVFTLHCGFFATTFSERALQDALDASVCAAAGLTDEDDGSQGAACAANVKSSLSSPFCEDRPAGGAGAGPSTSTASPALGSVAYEAALRIEGGEAFSRAAVLLGETDPHAAADRIRESLVDEFSGPFLNFFLGAARHVEESGQVADAVADPRGALVAAAATVSVDASAVGTSVATAPAAEEEQKREGKSKLVLGLIIAGAGVGLAALLGVLAWLWRRRMKAAPSSAKERVKAHEKVAELGSSHDEEKEPGWHADAVPTPAPSAPPVEARADSGTKAPSARGEADHGATV